MPVGKKTVHVCPNNGEGGLGAAVIDSVNITDCL